MMERTLRKKNQKRTEKGRDVTGRSMKEGEKGCMLLRKRYTSGTKKRDTGQRKREQICYSGKGRGAITKKIFAREAERQRVGNSEVEGSLTRAG